ncbi:efflux RND transporter permease subunit [Pseudoalteromonas sp. JBTF-M23]|uniref:Efflux RND transporter permease subunit n=1 Tax=Pseudoalteromonas caenipelagi TaxID=2726988 RepID=A0A849VFW6_9GAMM|nr:efflux RND transporter permease subunit [Pseudoalteromonas caenipelagi]NOU51403.1 efflux RND transporter permease subunit [Pseudoalteromonas caenipelagi]
MRQYFVISICTIIFIFGGFCILKNKVQLLPDIEPPKISFSVAWPGATEEFLISDVVKPYEDSILGKLDHFEALKVTTKAESASFEVTFAFGTDLDEAEKELASLLSRARPLPLNIKALLFRHGGSNVSNRVVGSYFITSELGEFSQEQLRLINNLASHKFKLLRGVEEVELNPLLENQLQVRLDMEKLYQLHLSFEKVRSIVSNMLTQPVTRLYEGDSVITAKFKQTSSLDDIRQTPVSYVNGVAILLQDIAEVSVEPIIQTATARYNGQQAIAMRILRDAEANLIEVQHLVDSVLVQEANVIRSSGLSYNLSFDTGLFIERAIVWILGSLATGFLLTLLVSYVFFKRIQPTLLGGLITLLSTCGVFIVLSLTNTSINVISLAGITFATGMFVDGVLIFVEYLDRLKKEQKSTLEKINQALNKLVPALFASSLTTVIVFVPVIFSDGAEGQLFRGLSLAITSGLIFALLFTILITPFFALRYLPHREAAGELAFIWVVKVIKTMLVTKKRSATVLTALILFSFVGLIGLFPSISYLPSVKRDAVDVYIPVSGSNRIEAVDRDIIEPLNQVLQTIPGHIELKNNYVIGWPFFATAAVRLENTDQLPELLTYLKDTLKEELPQQRVIVLQGELLGGAESSNNIEVNLFVNDKHWLGTHIEQIREMVTETLPGVSLRVTPGIDKAVSEYELTPNLAQLRHLNVGNEELKNLVKAIGQADFIGKWNDSDEVLNGYITLKETNSKIENIPYVASNGVRSFVGELMSIEESRELPSLIRLNGTKTVTLSLRITDKQLTVSDVMDKLESDLVPQLKSLVADKGFISVEGSAASLTKTKLFLAVMLLFVVVAFFVIVAGLFKSVKLSVYVLVSLMPALCGSILAYQALGLFTPVDFNVLTMLGFAIMLGIVANNSILLVDAMQQGFAAHHDLLAAIVAGTQERVRAVVISSLTTILGMLPLLLFPSDASQIYQGIAAIIVGGITINLLTVLFVIPASAHLFGLSTVKNGSVQAEPSHNLSKVA